MSTGAALAFAVVVGARFVLPLFILRYPLPAIIACLVLDGVDQTIFQSLGYDPPGYQGYDKAMDVYYLAVAYMATMRNWTSRPAFDVSRFLFFYRMVGVVAFELSQLRPLLMIFPNTFEYFFIAYESMRTRWNPLRFGVKAWLLVAAGIWVFIKLPQEWWIHIAKLDLTEMLGTTSWFGPVAIIVLLALLAAFWFAVRPRLVPADWTWRLAADPLPRGLASATERDAWRAQRGKVASVVTVEKVVLVGLLSVIFAQVLPGIRSTNFQLFAGLGVLVVVNTAISLWAARGSRSLESLTATLVLRVLLNVSLVALAEWLLGQNNGDLPWGTASFFVVLLSLLTTLHDRYQPVHDFRMADLPLTRVLDD